jgi:glycosyltransferase involved in cell wall biosynthesis
MISNLCKISFIGTVGIPNLYGGFESFLESCTPEMLESVASVKVTCHRSQYKDLSKFYLGVERVFLDTPPNGPLSIIHDLFAFLKVFNSSTHIVILGVSGGIWFPLFRFLTTITNKILIVNIDGVEWRRKKHNLPSKFFLWISNLLAQLFSNKIIYDNFFLFEYIIKCCRKKSYLIEYPGDHVVKFKKSHVHSDFALTVCRIEPENNLEILIEGFLKSNLPNYTIVGNWNSSSYGEFLRQKYGGIRRLSLLDPIYDPQELSVLRGSCAIYLHGHSVGGTNPSLVEMLFYDCAIICFDVPFNRYTAGNSVFYFHDENDLSILLNSSLIKSNKYFQRIFYRKKYTKFSIIKKYLQIF